MVLGENRRAGDTATPHLGVCRGSEGGTRDYKGEAPSFNIKYGLTQYHSRIIKKPFI